MTDSERIESLKKKLTALEQTARPKKISAGWRLLLFLIVFSLTFFVLSFFWHWQ